jgi:PncC family amidohydrolase
VSLPVELGTALRAKGMKLAVAESCTGGKVSDMITSVAGSSDYFLGGVVSYSNEAKVALLQVDSGMLMSEGAVSEAVAVQMADGARRAFGADVGLSTTGIAGPGGGSASKPIGLVFIAVSVRDTRVCRRHVFPGSREDVKRGSSEAAIALAREVLDGLD